MTDVERRVTQPVTRKMTATLLTWLVIMMLLMVIAVVALDRVASAKDR